MIEKKVSRLKPSKLQLFFLLKYFKSSELITLVNAYWRGLIYTVMRPERKPMQVFNEEKSKVQINIDSTLQKKQVGVHDLLEVIKMQNEINELRKNGKLTPEDTIRIKNLYNKLNK